MAAEIVMAQVDGASQVTQLLSATGSKTFTLGKVSTVAGAGNQTLLTLTPSAGGSAVMVKLEGARQAAELSALAGKTVAIGKPSMMAGGAAANNWLIFKPVGAGAAKAAAGSTTLLKLEGARQGMQAASLSGQKFTVVQPMMAGKTAAGSTLYLQPAAGGDMVALKMANGTAASNLVGKSVVVGKAPVIAGGNTSTWLALKPAAATGAKTAGAATAKSAAAASTAPAALKMQTVAMTTTTPAAAAAGKTAAAGTAAKSVATGGTIWKGTSLSLGLGMGLGVWGPVILAGVGASAAYGYWRSRRNSGSEEVAV
ncbi:MAG: hypothetical protein H7842_05030 [Gammaproteobacteria bacterium SHHR-1]